MPTANSQSKTDVPTAAAIVAWLASQLAALGVCAGHIMLWARAPGATERSALAVMVGLQIAVSAVIFPHLLGSIRSTIQAIASAWTLGVLAGVLSDSLSDAVIRSEVYVTIWLLALHIWNRASRTSAGALLGTAIASVLTIGGPLLWYLREDFGVMNGSSDWGSLALFGPLAGAVSQTFSPVQYGIWIELGLIFCTGVAAQAIRMIFMHRSRQVIH